MDLRRLIPLLRRWLPLMLVAAALTGGAGYVVSNLQAKTYESKATLIVGQSLSAVNPDYTDLLVSRIPRGNVRVDREDDPDPRPGHRDARSQD